MAAVDFKGCDLRDGWLWPSTDTECYKAVMREHGDSAFAVAHLGRSGRRGIALQAGGNCGVWALRLGNVFKQVITFEPDPLNFECLVANTRGLKHITRFQAALGDRPGFVGLSVDPQNVGATFVSGAGLVPVMQIDALGLPGLDYLVLDIEGYELYALRGAETTLDKYRPVVQLEEKGLGARLFDQKSGEAAEFLCSRFGYKVIHRVHNDLVLA
jgi:FkbM family methyltransferase